MIKTSFSAFKLNRFWLSWIKAGREYALQTVADGICFVCLRRFAVCFWVLIYVLHCSAKRLSSRGSRVAFSFSGASYSLSLVKFSERRKYWTFCGPNGLCSTAMLFWRAGWEKGVKDPAIRDLEAQIGIKKVPSKRRKQTNMFQRGERNMNMGHTRFVCSVLQSRK